LWALKRIDGYTYTLRNIETGKYLSFGKGNLLDTARTVETEIRIVIENFNVDDGYRLYADTASEYLGDVLNISTEAGMPLVVWKQTGTQNQSFKFEYMGDESAYSSSSEDASSSGTAELMSSSSSEGVSSSSAEITSIVAAPQKIGARVVGVSRVDGLRFSQAPDYALMNLHGMVVARGHAAQVAVKNLAPGAYVVRLGGRIQKIELR
jgi:hypothetical protein